MKTLINFPKMRVGRFPLKKGEKIPLHIHYKQYGLAYLLSGRCFIKSYNILERDKEELSLMLFNEIEIQQHDYQILTPTLNAHEILAIEDCLFLDIFSPGKQAGLLSEYLEILEEKNKLIKARIIPP